MSVSLMKKAFITSLLFLFSIFMLGFADFNEKASATAEDVTFEMICGASVRKVAPYGIKFSAKIGKDLYSSDKQFSIMITTRKSFDLYGESDYVDDIDKNGGTVAVVKADIDFDGEYYFASGSLAKVLYANLNRDFIGIAFYTDGNGDRVYADFNEEAATRNIAFVASRALNSDETFNEAQTAFLRDTIDKSLLCLVGMTEQEANEYLANSTIDYSISETTVEDEVVLTLSNDLDVESPNIYCEWSSSDSGVVEISESGVLSPISAGTAVITCKALGNTYNYEYTVEDSEDYSEYLDFTELGDGTYEVKAKEGATLPSELKIPSSYGGKTVSKIANSAFSMNTSITSVTILGGVITIGDSAFSKCSGIETVTMANSVVIIGASVFKNCTSLSSVSLSNNLSEINGYVFYGCSSLESIYLPSSLTLISTSAFANCSSLNSATFGDAKNWGLKSSLHGAVTDYLSESDLIANSVLYLTETYKANHWVKQ